MSLEASKWAWDQPVKGTKKLVLLALADYADAEMTAWPALDKIVQRCGVTRRVVQVTITDLVREGYLTRTERRRENGSQRTNYYILGSAADSTGGALLAAPLEQPDEPKVVVPPLSADAESPPPEQIGSFGVLHGRKMSTPADRWMLSAAIDAIGAHYAAVMKPRSDTLDAEQRKLVRDALDVATVAECKYAIDGCAASEFHMGKNDRRQKYNRLSQILKGKRGGRTTREQIDMFLEIAENGGSQSGVTSADHARVQQAKRDVLDGWEFPNDTQAVERANEAKAWLRQQGWQIEYAEGGRPQFTAPGS